MHETPQHQYQILTKRHKRLLELGDKLEWTPNIWMGVSVENQQACERITALQQVPAHIRFLSCEPLLSQLNLDLTGIHWVIVGGESGLNHRPIKQAWVAESPPNLGETCLMVKYGRKCQKLTKNYPNFKNFT